MTSTISAAAFIKDKTVAPIAGIAFVGAAARPKLTDVSIHRGSASAMTASSTASTPRPSDPHEVGQVHIAHDLRAACGIRPGDILIVHASMKSIGHVRGGPAVVIRALQQAVGETGTLLMPTFTDPPDDGVCDLRHAPSRTGLITETFRTAADVRRSQHPTHSVSAWGRRRDQLLTDHAGTSGLGVGSPLHKAAQAGARVLMIGCDVTRCSVVHVAEAIHRVPYLGRAWYPGYDRTLTMIDARGRPHRVPPRDQPGDSSQFVKVQHRMLQSGRARYARLGQARCLTFTASDALDAAAQLLSEDPLAFLCTSRRCSYCTAARRALKGQVSGSATPAPAERRASDAA